MKLIVIILVFISSTIYSQDTCDSLLIENNKIYRSYGLDLGISSHSSDFNTPILLYRANISWHHDFNEKTGLLFGVSLGNGGYSSSNLNKSTYSYTSITTYATYIQHMMYYSPAHKQYLLKPKFGSDYTINQYSRTIYSIGLPFAFKLGNIYNFKYVHIGTEIEFPFLLTVNAWEYGGKSYSQTSWFDPGISPLLFSFTAGFQTSFGLSVKLKYCLNSLMDFDEIYDTHPSGYQFTLYPFKNSINLLQFTIAYNLFHLKKNC